jgi:hypothetical protein
MESSWRRLSVVWDIGISLAIARTKFCTRVGRLQDNKGLKDHEGMQVLVYV